MLGLAVFAATFAVSAFGFLTARRFVRERLKYVEGAQTLRASLVAGLVAWAIALPLTWIIPLVGGGAALLFGAAVALGVRTGARDIREGRRLIEQ